MRPLRRPHDACALDLDRLFRRNIGKVHTRRSIAELREACMTGILDGKVALVTGGGSGIGRATAIAMVREGARVAVSDLSKEGIEATVALINSAGGQGIAIAGDVTEEADVANMVSRTVSAFGRID